MATIGGTPTSVMAPKVMKVPPPATALTAPDRKPASKQQDRVENGHVENRHETAPEKTAVVRLRKLEGPGATLHWTIAWWHATKKDRAKA